MTNKILTLLILYGILSSCSGQTQDKYNGLPQVYLGQGVDYMTGLLKSTYTDEEQMIRCDKGTDNCKSVIQSSASQYQDFSRFDATKEGQGQASKYNVKAGISASYGLFKASLKTAFQSQKSSSQTDGVLSKKVGLVRKRTYYLPYDSQDGKKEPNSIDIKLTAEAILDTSSFIKEQITQINEAYINNSPSFNLLVAEFYKTFGTHFISSVTRGQIGYAEVTLTYKGNQGDSASSFAGEASLSGVLGLFGGGGTAGGGYASSDAFSKDNYSYESITYASPDLQQTRDSLKYLKENLDKEMQAAQSIYNFKAFDPEKYKGGLSYPDLPNVPTPTDAEKAQAKENWKKKWNKDTKVTDLQLSFSRIQEILTKAVKDPSYNSKEICEPYQKLKQVLEEIRELQFADNYFDQGETRLVEKSRIVEARLSGCSGFTHAEALKLNEELTKKEQHYKDEDSQKKKAGEQKDFLKWMQDVKYPEEVPDPKKKTFDQWYGSKKASEILSYKTEWVEYHKGEGTITETMSVLLQNNQMRRRNVGSQRFSRESTSKEATDDYATLDYNIAPWYKIFPILDATLKDNFAEAIILKLFLPLNDFLETRAYLKLAKNSLANSTTLNDLFIYDLEIENNINKLATAILDSYDDDLIVELAGSYYDLTQQEGLNHIEELIKDLLSKSIMMSFDNGDWYKAVSKLREIGVISPIGSLISFANGSMTNSLALRQQQGYANTSLYSAKSLGEQLAMSDHPNVFTVLPILKDVQPPFQNYKSCPWLDEVSDIVAPFVYLDQNNKIFSYYETIPTSFPDTMIPGRMRPFILKTLNSDASWPYPPGKDTLYSVFVGVFNSSQSCYTYPFNDGFLCYFYLVSDSVCKFDDPTRVLTNNPNIHAYNAPITPYIIESYKSSHPKTDLRVKLFYNGGFSVTRQIATMFLSDNIVRSNPPNARADDNEPLREADENPTKKVHPVDIEL